MTANERAGSWPEEQHIPVAQQLVRSHRIQNNPRVRLAGDLKTDPGGQIALDQARDNVDRWFLGRENQVNSDGPALLSQSDDMCLDLFAGGHHQVGHFVHNNHDERQVIGNQIRFFIVLRL